MLTLYTIFVCTFVNIMATIFIATCTLICIFTVMSSRNQITVTQGKGTSEQVAASHSESASVQPLLHTSSDNRIPSDNSGGSRPTILSGVSLPISPAIASTIRDDVTYLSFPSDHPSGHSLPRSQSSYYYNGDEQRDLVAPDVVIVPRRNGEHYPITDGTSSSVDHLMDGQMRNPYQVEIEPAVSKKRKFKFAGFLKNPNRGTGPGESSASKSWTRRFVDMTSKGQGFVKL